MGVVTAPSVITANDLANEYPDFWSQGACMSCDDAVKYALRGRGRRRVASVGWESLTPTELEVIKHVSRGETTPEIATQLVVSPRTVQSHLSSVYAKLNVRNRAELASLATSRGL